MPCLQSDILERFVLGTLDEPVAGEVERHLFGCKDCRAILQKIETTLDDPFADELRLSVQNPEISALVDNPETNSTEWFGFRLLKKIGVGGMGTVYEAVEQETGELRAVKILRSFRQYDPAAVSRFHREKEIVAKLDHPNIVRSFPIPDTNPVSCIVMERLHGMDLAQYIEQHGPLTVDAACKLIVQAAASLQYAHENGIVHRDIKPSNLFLSEDGTLKILDLGLARLLDSDTERSKTQSGHLLGSPEFMSPEQILAPTTLDHRSDIYSLGGTFYFLLTGMAPFADREYETVVAKLAGHANESAPDVRKLRKDVSADLASVLSKMLEKSPDRRFRNMNEVVDAVNNPRSIRNNSRINIMSALIAGIVLLTGLFFLPEKKSLSTAPALSDTDMPPVVEIAETTPPPTAEETSVFQEKNEPSMLQNTVADKEKLPVETNLVKNGSFENGYESQRDDWQRQQLNPTVQFGISSDSHDGTVSATIESATGGAGVWRQFVEIEPNATYRVSYWYKLDRVQPVERQDCGMEPCIAVGVYEPNSVGGYSWKGTDRPEGSVNMRSVKGSRNWTRFEQLLVAGPTDSHALIAFRFGALRNVTWHSAKGKIYIDDVKLVKIDDY